MTVAERVSEFTGGGVATLGTVLAIYAGLWLCLIGGASDIINAFNPFTAGLLALGIIKLFICDVVGFGIFSAGIALASWIKGDSNDNPKAR